jgi:hypothetical protein
MRTRPTLLSLTNANISQRKENETLVKEIQ